MLLAATRPIVGDDARKVWTEALKIEEKAVKMYSEEASKETDASRKSLLERIADEAGLPIVTLDEALGDIVRRTRHNHIEELGKAFKFNCNDPVPSPIM